MVIRTREYWKYLFVIFAVSLSRYFRGGAIFFFFPTDRSDAEDLLGGDKGPGAYQTTRQVSAVYKQDPAARRPFISKRL